MLKNIIYYLILSIVVIFLLGVLSGSWWKICIYLLKLNINSLNLVINIWNKHFTMIIFILIILVCLWNSLMIFITAFGWQKRYWGDNLNKIITLSFMKFLNNELILDFILSCSFMLSFRNIIYYTVNNVSFLFIFSDVCLFIDQIKYFILLIEMFLFLYYVLVYHFY